MTTEQYTDFEIADGVYELANSKTLRVWHQGDGQWACVAYDHGGFCRRCQHISEDEIQASLISLVIDGQLQMVDHAERGWLFHTTPAGDAHVAEIMGRSNRTPEDLTKMSEAELRVFLNGPTRLTE